MTTILPPTDRKNFESEQEYNKAYKEWKKMFDSAMKDTNYNEWFYKGNNYWYSYFLGATKGEPMESIPFKMDWYMYILIYLSI